MRRYLLGIAFLLVISGIVGCSGEKKSREAVVYYVDDKTGEVLTKAVETSNESDVWKELQNTGVLTEDCQLISFEINEESESIILDFNDETGKWIRSMGTTGEIQIIGCIVNTFLDTYGCNEIQLTEEGNLLDSSHGADYSGYMRHIAF